MSAIKFFTHLFLPHHSNNQKAKLLHSDTLSVIVLFLLGFQLLLNIFPKSLPGVLGYAADISPSEVIRLTNNERLAVGLSPLAENKILDNAALAKGQDMLSKGYWAHFGPDGTSPWSFFLQFGYKYQYAGENLARDFSNASGAVTAWMNSSTHKENILNPHYKEVGIGVVEGSLLGNETTIIVQFFGSPLGGFQPIPVARAEATPRPIQSVDPVPVDEEEKLAYIDQNSPSPSPLPVVTPSSASDSISTSSNIKISPFETTRKLSLGFVGIILMVLSIDLLLVRRRRIFRVGGRTLAHLAYLSMVLAVILILKAGRII